MRNRHFPDNLQSHCMAIKKYNFQIEEPASMEGGGPTRRKITMDLPPATLNTLVDDFTRIREQLANIARK